MNEYEVKILEIKNISQNNFNIRLEKPEGYTFIPGQFAEITLVQHPENAQKSSFCFTGLADLNYLEFIIRLNKNNLLKKRIVSSQVGDSLIISNARGTFRYKGMGVFIAAGSGISPVIAILRDLKVKHDLAGNMVIYSNKTWNDIIFHDELTEMLGNEYINVFTEKRYKGYYFGRIDKNYLRMEIVDFIRYFYLCGSMEFVNDMKSILQDFDVEPDSIIFEQAFTNYPIEKIIS